MLRGRPEPMPVFVQDASPWPGGETGFETAERPAGIRFYRAKDSFFRPYVMLRGMSLTETQLTFTFADDEVLVQGHGLHAVYVAAAEQRLAWLCVQRESIAAAGSSPVAISHIAIVPRRDSAQS